MPMGDDSTAPVPGRLAWTAGLLGLLVALSASGMLVAEHLQLMGESLPGCGPRSGCAKITAGPWGSIPGLGWPVSFVGFAFFAAILASWCRSRRGISPILRRAVLVGGAGSLAFLVIMLGVERAFCIYCVSTHLGNFLLVTACLVAGRASIDSFPQVATAAFAFLIATGGLAGGKIARDDVIRERREQRLAENIEEVIGGGDRHAFTGRWRYGPEDARIQVVFFSDYQCPDCQRVEGEMKQLVQMRGDVSISMKHFPMSSKCQPDLARDLHPNACWAARAAETAGILGGNDSFWKMHFWLFGQGGSFTDASLPGDLRRLGFDPGSFIPVMTSHQTMARVRADIDEAKSLGIFYTPMIFINGVEMKEIRAPFALTRAITALGVALDRGEAVTYTAPPPARDKYVDDWRDSPRKTLPYDPTAWPSGPEDAAVNIVVWGDFQQPYTRELDALIREIPGDDIRYTFRHFPIDEMCNPGHNFKAVFDGSCLAAMATEAAGELGGTEAYWRVHSWMMSREGTITTQTLRQAALEAGLDPVQLVEVATSARVADTIAEDVRAARSLPLHTLPEIHVNGKKLPRWRLASDPEARVLAWVIKEARQSP